MAFVPGRRRGSSIDLRPSVRAKKSYKWETIKPYLCPDCRSAFEAVLDAQWCVWVERVRREDAEALIEMERVAEEQRQRSERDERKQEQRRARRAVANEQSTGPVMTENGPDADISALDDRVFEAWVDAFTYPSDEAVKGLLRLTAKNEAVIVAESVRIAGKKRDLQEDDARLKYIGGILRNKRLEVTSPELASRLRNVKWLTEHWKNQPRGTGYLPVWMLKGWLKSCTPEEIRTVMDLTGGYYGELRNEMESLIESKDQ
jgi:hypothetical protein